jgi:hypothetical protein
VGYHLLLPEKADHTVAGDFDFYRTVETITGVLNPGTNKLERIRGMFPKVSIKQVEFCGVVAFGESRKPAKDSHAVNPAAQSY